MNKKLTQRFLATIAIAAMFVGSVLAQNPPAPYVAASGNQATDIDSVSVAPVSDIGYYVLPDVYYHPTYVATGTLSVNFVWNWTLSPAGPTISAAQTATNYVTADFSTATAGTLYNLTANEQNDNLTPSCAGQDTNMYVRAIATPTVAYTSGAGFIDADLTVCEGDADLLDLVQMTFTHSINQANDASLQLNYTLAVDTVSLAGPTVNIVARSFDSTATSVADEQVTGLDLATGGVYNLYRPTAPADYTCIENAGGTKRATIYTYTVTGVNDRISRKSEYIANPGATLASWTFYDNAADAIVITVNPAPVTGPIYHIPNLWAN